MKININDIDKVSAAVKAAEGQARERKFHPQTVYEMAKKAERHLHSMGLPKKHWPGVMVAYIPEGVANAYKYAAQGTFVTISRFPTGWFVTNVKRGYCDKIAGGSYSRIRMRLTPKQMAELPSAFNL